MGKKGGGKGTFKHREDSPRIFCWGKGRRSPIISEQRHHQEGQGQTKSRWDDSGATHRSEAGKGTTEEPRIKAPFFLGESGRNEIKEKGNRKRVGRGKNKRSKIFTSWARQGVGLGEHEKGAIWTDIVLQRAK